MLAGVALVARKLGRSALSLCPVCDSRQHCERAASFHVVFLRRSANLLAVGFPDISLLIDGPIAGISNASCVIMGAISGPGRHLNSLPL